MTIDSFLDNLQREQGIEISATDNNIRIRGDKKLLTQNILDEIGKRKGEILSHLGKTSSPGLTVAPVKDKYSLSAAQRRIYFMYEFDKNSVAYNIQDAIRITGKLDKAKVVEAFRQLAQRHNILRTTFINHEGDVYQQISAEATIDVVHVDPAKSDDETIAEFARPFDLSKLPLFRVGIKTKSRDESLIVVDVHHIVTDGVSQRILLSELMKLYAGESLPALSLQYNDFAEWQQTDDRKSELNKQKDFWLNEFQEVPSNLELPFDFARPGIMTGRGSTHHFTITGDKATKLRQLAEKEGMTVFVMVLTLYYVLLSKLSSQESITIGTPVDGRRHKGLESMIGIFFNTLTLKARVVGKQSFKELLSDVRDNLLASYLNQDFQYDSLIDALKIDRSSGQNPLFNAMLSYKSFSEVDLRLNSSFGIEYVNIQRNQAKLDITLFAEDKGNEIVFDVLYSDDLFKTETIGRFAQYFKSIASQVIDNISVAVADINILSEDETNTLLKVFNSNQVTTTRHDTVLSMIGERAQLFPNDVAVSCDETSLSYRELSEKSDSLAAAILNSGVASGLVPVAVQSSVWLAVAIFGVWKAGKAYVPIDPEQSSARTSVIREETRSNLLITDSKSIAGIDFDGQKIIVDGDLPENRNYKTPPVNGNDIAYVIYTSGSSGTPKGVEITHANLANYSCWLKETINLGNEDRSLLTSSYAFDLGYSSIFPVLIAGGTLHIAGRSLYEVPDRLAAYIAANSITYLKMTPSLFSTIVHTGNFTPTAMKNLKYVLLGGEKLVAADVMSAVTACNHVRFINHYGPTETTIGVVANEIKDPSQLSNRCIIGKPIANTKAYILDRDNNLLPIGVLGELCIGGASVGKGYLHRSELTKEKFISLSFVPGEVVYRTGDLARWLPDGTIELRGRIDNQVKIRGYRVEPEEVSRALETHAGIVKAAVIAVGNDSSKRLVAYYTPGDNTNEEDIREFLSKKLPEYMMPSTFVKLEQFPLTPNGKLDVRLLPASSITNTAPSTELTPNEKILLEVWSGNLTKENLTIDDNFFSAGGDSIKSILISSKLRKLGFDVTVRDIFKSQTIRALALQMKRLTSPATKTKSAGKSKLTPIQREFFLNEKIRNKKHYNQAVALDLDVKISKENTAKIFHFILNHHDALRSVFRKDGNDIFQYVESDVVPSLEVHDFRQLNDAEFNSEFLTAAEIMQSSLDELSGPLVKVGLFKRPNGTRLFIVIHHLVVDGVSWRILLEDIETLCRQTRKNKPLSLLAKTDDFTQWTETLSRYAESHAFKKACVYWKNFSVAGVQLPGLNARGKHYFTDSSSVAFTLDHELTSKLLTDANRPFRTGINDILLGALALSFGRLHGDRSLTIDLEGHGREIIAPGINFDRTVGWFTSIYPVVLNASPADIGEVITDVKETLRRVPNNGIDYLLFKQLNPDSQQQANVRFNYLGQINDDGQDTMFRLYRGPVGELTSTQNLNRYQWDISGIVVNNQLEMRLNYSTSQFSSVEMGKFMDSFKQALVDIVDYCSSLDKIVPTPSDFTYKKLPAHMVKELCRQNEVEDIWPLSPTQKGMLFHSFLDNNVESYFEQKCLYVTGNVDIAKMEESLYEITKRYSILRTKFVYKEYDEPFQLVLSEKRPVFSFEDLRKEDYGDIASIIEQRKRDDRANSFDLGEDSLIRLKILQTGYASFVLVWSYHHILMDGWCMAIVVNDFNELYRCKIRGTTPVLAPVKSYLEYLTWLSAKDAQADSEYWQQNLSGFDVLTSIPRKRSWTTQSVYRQEIKTVSLSKQNTELLTAASAKYGVTLNSILQLAWSVVLSKCNRVDDVVFGSVVSGRPVEIEDVESIVGLFINTVPVRIRFSAGDRAEDILRRINDVAIESLAHHHAPLFEIQSKSELGRELFDQIMILENYPVTEELKGTSKNNDLGYRINQVGIFEQTNYGLELNITPGDELKIEFIYDANKYDARVIDRFVSYFTNALGRIYSTPGIRISEIDILSSEEREKILSSFNNTARYLDRTKTFFDLFAEQVKLTPDNIAVEHNGVKLSYCALYDGSVALASEFRSMGLQKDGRVALVIPRGIQMLKSIIAAYACGASYVPVDVEFPNDRIDEILSDCEPDIVVTDDGLRSGTAAGSCVEDLAYIIYTSGTTGKPKGAMVHQLGLVNHLWSLVETLELTPSDVIAQTASPCFDISVWQFLCPLIVGAKTHIVDKTIAVDPLRLVKMLKRSGVTVFQSVPSLLSTLMLQLEDDDSIDLPQLRWLIPTGEQLSSSLVDQLRGYFPSVRMLNAYGPAEASDDVSLYEIGSLEEPGSIAVGKPIQNTHIYIVDQFGHLSPVGVVGEICVSGVCVGKGYWKDPGKTNDAFVPNPFANDLRSNDYRMMYKTGDLGYWNENGNLVCVGRRDDQVKIRGVRVELAEIQNAILSHKEVRGAVVIVRGEGDDKNLVGYYTAATSLSKDEIRDHVATKLPPYLIPPYLVQIPSMPVTTNGKIDKKGLPEIDTESIQHIQLPVNDIEAELLTLWSEVLDAMEENISTNAGFFEIGGHSLRATRLINKINKNFNVELSLMEIFEKQTIKEQAELIANIQWSSEQAESKREVTI